MTKDTAYEKEWNALLTRFMEIQKERKDLDLEEQKIMDEMMGFDEKYEAAHKKSDI